MSQQEIEQLDNLMRNINNQLTELSVQLAKLAGWSDSTFKQEMLNRIVQNQDKLFASSNEVHNRLKELGL